MVSVMPKHMAAFGLGLNNGALWRKYKDSELPDTAWTGWLLEGGTWIQDPVTITRVLGEVNVFMVDTNHALQQSNFNFLAGHGLGPWKNLGGKLLGVPAVANSTGTIHIFYIGTDHALYHKAWDGVGYTPEEGYEKLGGIFLPSPAAVSTGEEEVSVFAVGLTDGCLHYHHWKSSSGWDPVVKLPGLWAGTPTVISDQEGAWDLFGISTEGKINHVSHRYGTQTDLKTISGVFKSVDAISRAPGKVDLFAWGLDCAIYHKSSKDGTWKGWENLQGTMKHHPAPVSHSLDALCVIAVGVDLSTYIKIMDPNTGIWSDWANLQGPIVSRVA